MAVTFSDAKRIPIEDYLSGLGVEPVKIRGNDYWYHSPFRQDHNPSFKVNTKLNVWYDHGVGEGGTILDLGSKLYQCTIQEFLKKLSSNPLYIKGSTFHQEPPLETERKLEILSTQDLTSADLMNYLSSRGIDKEIAKRYCKEVDFRIDSKTYSAVGFQNRSGGYELRNRWFKGSSSPKDISLIDNRASKLCVLEGFIDFLSIIQVEDQRIKSLAKHSDFLVLNSLSFLKRNLPMLESRPEIILFLDNDVAAKKAMESLTSKGVLFRDASTLYLPHKDMNDFLISHTSKGSTLTRSKGIGM